MKELVEPKSRRRRKPSKPENRTATAYQSKSIGRALDVLDAFSLSNSPMSLSDLSAYLTLPETTLFRICVTLQGRGYLHQNTNGTFELAPRVLHGIVRPAAEQVRDVALPHLLTLAMGFDETTSLAYLFENRIEVLHTLEAMYVVRTSNWPGRVLPPHCSSLGKAIAAFQSRDKIESILQTYGLSRRTANTIMDRRTLFEEFETIRNQSYSLDREEAAEGQFCIGAPILGPGNAVNAAISLSMPVARINAERTQAMISAIVETASKIAAAQQKLPNSSVR